MRLQYAPKGNLGPDSATPSIEIVLSLEGRDAEDHFMAVADNGTGMNEKQMENFLQ